MSEQTKHTPGPWSKVGEESPEIIDSLGFQIAGIHETCVLLDWANKLDIEHWGRLPGKSFIERPRAEVEANACLMVNAPETAAERDRLEARCEAFEARVAHWDKIEAIDCGDGCTACGGDTSSCLLALLSKVDKMKAQNAELLEALERASGDLQRLYHGGMCEAEPHQSADYTIAKVKEGMK